jgi:hypothetical protein
MKQAILTNWTFSRVLRLILGVVIVAQAISLGDATLGTVGLLFTLMPVFNIGCCGAGGCYTPLKKTEANDAKDITYEEIV